MSILSRSLGLEDSQSDMDLVALGVVEETPVVHSEVDYLDEDTVPVAQSPEVAMVAVDQHLQTLEELEEIQENQEEMQEQLEEQQKLIEEAIKSNGGVTQETAEAVVKSVERFYCQYEANLNKFLNISNRHTTSLESFKAVKLKPVTMPSLESFSDNSLKTISSEGLKDTLKAAIEKTILFLKKIWEAISSRVKAFFVSYFGYKATSKKKLEAILKKLKEIKGPLTLKELTGSYLKVISHQGKILEGSKAVDGFKETFKIESTLIDQTNAGLKNLLSSVREGMEAPRLGSLPDSVRLGLGDIVCALSGQTWSTLDVVFFRDEKAPTIDNKNVKAMSLTNNQIEDLAKTIIAHIDSNIFKSLEDGYKITSAALDKEMAEIKKATTSQEVNLTSTSIKSILKVTQKTISGLISYDKTIVSAGTKLCVDSLNTKENNTQIATVKK